MIILEYWFSNSLLICEKWYITVTPTTTLQITQYTVLFEPALFPLNVFSCLSAFCALLLISFYPYPKVSIDFLFLLDK